MVAFGRFASISSEVKEERIRIVKTLEDFAREKRLVLRNSVVSQWYPERVARAYADVKIGLQNIKRYFSGVGIGAGIYSDHFVPSIFSDSRRTNPIFNAYTFLCDRTDKERKERYERERKEQYPYDIDHIGHVLITCRDESLKDVGNEILGKFNTSELERLGIQYFLARESEVLENSSYYLYKRLAARHELIAKDVSLEKIAEKKQADGCKHKSDIDLMLEQKLIYFYNRFNNFVAEAWIRVFNYEGHYNKSSNKLNEQLIEQLIKTGLNKNSSIMEIMTEFERIHGTENARAIAKSASSFEGILLCGKALIATDLCSEEFAADFLREFSFIRIEEAELKKGEQVKGLVISNVYIEKKYMPDEKILYVPKFPGDPVCF